MAPSALNPFVAKTFCLWIQSTKKLSRIRIQLTGLPTKVKTVCISLSLSKKCASVSFQRYLTCFRVLELKELLRINGQSTKGRKPELFKRANDLLQFGSPKFLAKIQEIYERSNCTRKQYNYNRTAQRGSPAKSSTVIKNSSRSHIVHPDVKFKSHPFFSKLDTIIRPTALGKSSVLLLWTICKLVHCFFGWCIHLLAAVNDLFVLLVLHVHCVHVHV